MFGTSGGKATAGKSGMHDASALPDLHVLPAGLFLDEIAEIDIGQKEDRLFRRNGIYDRGGIARCAKNVAFRLHLDGSVDIAHDDMVGMPAAEGANGLGRATVDQAATCIKIR